MVTGATHQAEFYGTVTFYRLTHRLHLNTVIDHPEECWQRLPVWHYWDRGQWVDVGPGFSSRRLQPLQLAHHTATSA